MAGGSGVLICPSSKAGGPDIWVGPTGPVLWGGFPDGKLLCVALPTSLLPLLTHSAFKQHTVLKDEASPALFVLQGPAPQYEWRVR